MYFDHAFARRFGRRGQNVQIETNGAFITGLPMKCLAKLMSISDDMMWDWYELLSFVFDGSKLHNLKKK